MSETRFCGNPDALMSYLYDEDDAADRQAFETHLRSCEACAREVRELRALRTGLSEWEPPETLLDFRIVRGEERPRPWRSWFAIPVLPAWAQLGAAALLVGVAVGISGLEVRYDDRGVTVRTGWQRAATTQAAVAPPATAAVPAAAPVATQPAGAAGDAPWRAELASLERQLRAEMQRNAAAPPQARTASAAPANDDALIARVRQLIDASESRQQQDVALRLAQVTRDMDLQRRADLARMVNGLGLVEGRTGAAVAQQRDMLNYLMRVSTSRDPR